MDSPLLQDGLVIALNVAAMMAMGLELTPARLAEAARRYRPMAIGLAVNLLAAPAVAWLLIAGFDLPAAFAVGLLLCASAPGGKPGRCSPRTRAATSRTPWRWW